MIFCNCSRLSAKSDFLRDNHHSKIFPQWCYYWAPSRGLLALQWPCLVQCIMHFSRETVRNHDILQLQPTQCKIWLPQRQSPLQDLPTVMLWSGTIQGTIGLAVTMFDSIMNAFLSRDRKKSWYFAIAADSVQNPTSSETITTPRSSNSDFMIRHHPEDYWPCSDHVWFNV